MALAVAASSCSESGFGITGSLANAEGAKVMLYEQQLWGMTPLDSAVVKDGAFYLSGRLVRASGVTGPVQAACVPRCWRGSECCRR